MDNTMQTHDIIIDGNSGSDLYTKERDIVECSIKAPMINYLPTDWVYKNATSSFGPAFTKYTDHFHFDYSIPFNRGYDMTSLFLPLTNVINENCTLIFYLYNCIGTYYTNSENVWKIGYRNSSNEFVRIQTVYPTNGIKKIVINDVENICAIYYGFNNYTPSFSYSFDMKIIGLFKGDMESNFVTYSTMFPKTTLYLSSQNQVIGSAKATHQVVSHLKYIDRKIKKNENLFNINWR